VQKQAFIMATFYLFGAALIAALFLRGRGNRGLPGRHRGVELAIRYCRLRPPRAVLSPYHSRPRSVLDLPP